MPSSLFGTKQTMTPMTKPSQVTPLVTQPLTQQNVSPNVTNALNEITNALKATNGDLKSAFYKLAQDKNIDPNSILNEINSLTNPKAYINNLINNNPEMSQLLTLLSSIK